MAKRLTAITKRQAAIAKRPTEKNKRLAATAKRLTGGCTWQTKVVDVWPRGRVTPAAGPAFVPVFPEQVFAERLLPLERYEALHAHQVLLVAGAVLVESGTKRTNRLVLDLSLIHI